MPKAKKDEVVTVSFHNLTREYYKEDKENKIIPFTTDEFSTLFNKITNQNDPDLGDPKQFDGVKYGRIVPFSDVVLLDDERTIFGVFEGAYWGHGFKNSEKGSISAESINQRKFHFLLYLSLSGKIYVACQYLGNYGSYTSLKRCITDMLSDPKTIISNSYRQDSVDLSNVKAKEIEVTLATSGETITSSNIFSNQTMIAARKVSKDDGFENEVEDGILQYIKASFGFKKKKLAEMLNQNSLFEVKDEDIRDCTILATVNGRDKKIYLFEKSVFASRFKIDPKIGLDGHPLYEQTKKEMCDLLQKEIIAKAENV